MKFLFFLHFLRLSVMLLQLSYSFFLKSNLVGYLVRHLSLLFWQHSDRL